MSLPRKPGSYLLTLHLATAQQLRIGALGEQFLATGYYTYVGSALGPGGLAARLGHHLRPSRRCHWHVDYLRSVASVVAICYLTLAERREHQWADWLSARGVVAGFGTSDCCCQSHLFYHPSLPRGLGSALGQAFPGDPAPCCFALAEGWSAC